jgi:hypothetical protein
LLKKKSAGAVEEIITIVTRSIRLISLSDPQSADKSPEGHASQDKEQYKSFAARITAAHYTDVSTFTRARRRARRHLHGRHDRD